MCLARLAGNELWIAFARVRAAPTLDCVARKVDATANIPEWEIKNHPASRRWQPKFGSNC